MCFPVNFAECLRTALFIEHFRWLLLKPCNVNLVNGKLQPHVGKLEKINPRQCDRRKSE